MARYLGLSESSVRAIVARGDLPAEGWPLMVRRGELEAFVERSTLKRGDLLSMNPYRRA